MQEFDNDYIEQVSMDSQDVFMIVLMSLVMIALCIGAGIIVYRFWFATTGSKEKPKPVATKEEISLEEMAMCLE